MKKQKYRHLTEDEIAYLKPYFQDSLEYDKIKIYNRIYIPFFHPKNGGMAPNGNIYIRGKCYNNNYGASDVSSSSQAFLLHEMTHVWQKENKAMNLIVESLTENIRHKFNFNAAYPYTLEKGKDFLNYGLEQQASILQDYHTLKAENMVSMRLQNEDKSNIRELYKSVLSNFLKDPKYVRNCKRNLTGKAFFKP